MSHEPLPPIELPNGIVLPEATASRLLWGGHSRGSVWLRRVPDLVAEWCKRWNITLERDIPQLNYNLVLFGTTPNHGPVVIKMAPPHEEVTAEVEALRRTQRPGIVRLIDADPDVSIMLQERIVPGTPLRDRTESGAMTDPEATAIAAGAMKTYWTDSPDSRGLLTLNRWFESLYAYRRRHPDGAGPIPGDLVTLAIRHADVLLTTQQETVTLHGDLHHQNLLWDATRGWTIIDPKGLVGERGYDIATWMLNPLGLHSWPNLREVTEDRLDHFSDLLEVDRYRLWQWAMVHSVLSECWTAEDGSVELEDQLHALPVSRVLADLPEASR